MSLRRRALLGDVAIAAVLAGLLVALASGLALVAVVALSVLILVGVSLLVGRAWARLGRRRGSG